MRLLLNGSFAESVGGEVAGCLFIGCTTGYGFRIRLLLGLIIGHCLQIAVYRVLPGFDSYRIYLFKMKATAFATRFVG